MSLRNVRKIYRMGSEKIVALDNVSLDFLQGKIYCLVGISGSGKSTLLNMMAGLERPTKGDIIFMNKFNVSKISEKKLALYRQKNIGFVFQSYNLISTLSALENVTLPLVFRKMGKKKRNKIAAEILKAVGLKDREKHKPSELSGGQQQRVSIARAFVNNPKLVFADEPTGNLDTKTTAEMMSLITSIAKEHNQTMLIVTHNDELTVYCDYIIRIRDGNIESVEDCSEAKEAFQKARAEEIEQAKLALENSVEKAVEKNDNENTVEDDLLHIDIIEESVNSEEN